MSDMELPFRLNAADAQGETWQKLKRHLEAELAKRRQENDKDLDAEQTAKLRGRINELKRILTLDKPLPIEVE